MEPDRQLSTSADGASVSWPHLTVNNFRKHFEMKADAMHP
jgi:hypothetical protein